MALSNRRRIVFVAIALFCVGTAIAQVPSSGHIVLVIDENSSFTDVVANMPWLVAQGTLNGYASDYHSDNSGSLLDYLWLASGSCHNNTLCSLAAGTHNFYCTGDRCAYPGTNTVDPITDNSIFRELNNAGISWKVYAQSYAKAGGTPSTPDRHNSTFYYRRHNAATWYSDILSNVDGSADKIVDFSELSTDLALGTLPRFMIIVPDGRHDAHDCPVGVPNCTLAQRLAAADAFLQSTLDPILSTPDFQPGGTGLVIVTFDECGGGTNLGCGGNVYTAFIGPRVTPHTILTLAYKHQNALRTICNSLGISHSLGAAATAAPMSDFFTTSAIKPEVVITSPASAASLSSPITIEASAFPTSGHTISRWETYVDSVAKFSAGAVSAIAPSLNLPTGTHTIDVRAWDTSGAAGDQIFPLTVVTLTPTVWSSTPANGASVGSPVNIQAAASPTAGHSLSKWTIYLDGPAVYSVGAESVINANIPMNLGTHTLVIRTWDTSGAHAAQTLNLTSVNKPAVALSAPAASSNVNSPISVQASATPSSGHSITQWKVYLDGATAFQSGAASSISTSIPAGSGTHTVLVRAWDSSGAYGGQVVPVQVQPVAVNITNPLNGAAATSPVTINAQASSPNPIAKWTVYVDSVNSFEQNGGNAILADLTLAPGTHTIHVHAANIYGGLGDQTIKVTVP